MKMMVPFLISLPISNNQIYPFENDKHHNNSNSRIKFAHSLRHSSDIKKNPTYLEDFQTHSLLLVIVFYSF